MPKKKGPAPFNLVFRGTRSYGVRNRGSNKYGARKVEWGGQRFDSGLEARYAMLLDDQKKWGEIQGYERQVHFKLVVDGKLVTTHVVDFLVTFPDGRKQAHEVKGFATNEWRIKRKLFKALHPNIPYRVFGRDLIEAHFSD